MMIKFRDSFVYEEVGWVPLVISSDYVLAFNLSMKPSKLYSVRVKKFYPTSVTLSIPFTFTTPTAPGDVRCDWLAFD